MVTRWHSLSFVVPLVVIPYHSLSLFVIRCHSLYHSLSFVVTRCHSLSLVVPLVVIRCHSLPFVATRCNTCCHSLSLDVLPLVCLFINDHWLSIMWTNDNIFSFLFIISMASDSMSLLFIAKSDLDLNVRELWIKAHMPPPLPCFLTWFTEV